MHAVLHRPEESNSMKGPSYRSELCASNQRTGCRLSISRKCTVSGHVISFLFTVTLALLIVMQTDRVMAQAVPPTDQAPPPTQSGPIVGGHDIQPRPEQLPRPDVSAEDAEKMKQLYRDVLKDSELPKPKERREHQ